MRPFAPAAGLPTAALLLSALTAGCAPVVSGPPTPSALPVTVAGEARQVPDPQPTGLLVMAHGGGDEWDDAVRRAVAPLRQERPTALALGMADPVTLKASLDSLHQQGVKRVAVVRLFISGSSFLAQTRYLLGLGPAPTHFISHHGGGGTPEPIHHGLEVATHVDGLVDHETTGRILQDRSLALSRDPGAESVLWLAHGQGDPDANGRLETVMTEWARRLHAQGFAAVKAATLREDWPEARKLAEDEIRQWVGDQANQGRRVLVVPLRVSGFGPYGEVLANLPYDGAPGLLPHHGVTDWIREKVADVERTQGWSDLTTLQGR